MSDPADFRNDSSSSGRPDPGEPEGAAPDGGQATPSGGATDIAAEVRRAAAANMKWSMLFSGGGFVLALVLLVMALRAPGFQVLFAVLMLFLFGFRAYQTYQLRRLSEVTAVRDGVLESVGRDGYLVESGGVRLKMRVMRPRGNRFSVTPGQHVRVTEPFVAGQPVAIIFPGSSEVEGLLALPLAPARPA